MSSMKTSELATPAPDVSSRPRKRIKRNEDPLTTAQSVSKSNTSLFAPFRALGFVTNHVPFVLQVRTHKGASQGPRVHIITCLGRAWALWEGGKMTLLFVGS
jgi:U3 small nucleolar RNA-associated protein 21